MHGMNVKIHCAIIVEVYDYYIQSPQLWARHGALTITVDRLRAVGSADVVAGAVCHIQR